ncbi:MAG: DUF1211 domain-containing protein [Catonella sp.]|nr:MAG: DUF1211 domain-containing protein [Catonella sp.]
MLENLTKKFDALSDGLYAIIMTILVLSIKVPDKMSQLPQFGTDILWFLISFIIIANQWYRRARTMVLTEKISVPIMTWDMVNHMFICLVPLFLQLLTKFENYSLAVLSYGILITVISISSNFMLFRVGIKQLHAEKEKSNTDSNRPKPESKGVLIRLGLQIVLPFIGVLLLAYVFPHFAIFIYILLPVITFINNSMTERDLTNQDVQTMSDYMTYRFAKKDDK